MNVNKNRFIWSGCFRNSESGSVDRVPCHGTIAMSGRIVFLLTTFVLNYFTLFFCRWSKSHIQYWQIRCCFSHSTCFSSSHCRRPANSSDVERFGPLQQQREWVLPVPFALPHSYFVDSGNNRKHLSFLPKALAGLQFSAWCRSAPRCLTPRWWWWTDRSLTSVLRASPSCKYLSI